MIASFIEDNALGIASFMATIVVGVITWMTKFSSDMTQMRSDIRHLRELAELAGNGSRQRDESAAQRIAYCEQQIREIELRIAGALSSGSGTMSKVT